MSSTTSVPEATDCSDSLVKAAQQVAARLELGETRTPGLADLFVAIMKEKH
ncbi:hypothetical protein [Pseudofulvimonas gallinarii]|uniref:hypothetical protein n=1 Tax=Pseudofulvimonas gallinarii TaxID=634155 RepID=UPI0035E4D55A